ncbi:MAG: hypothetical protein H7138_18080 [Myxococcales bacterium]|nr:hypothetical protein [Myxococcales bacterium]
MALLTACSVPAVTFTPGDDVSSDAGVSDGSPVDTPIVGRDMATLTVRRSGDGAGLVSGAGELISCGAACTVTVAIGTEITLVATPETGAVFGGWTGGGCAGSETRCVVTVTDDVAVTAQFDVMTFTVDVALAGSGTGMVMSNIGVVCPGMCTRLVAYNATVTLLANALAGSTFTGWSGPCSGIGACSFTVTADTTVTAGFAANVPLTVTRVGNGAGTVSSVPAGIQCGTDCTEGYPPGTAVTLTATRTGDSVFVGWSGAGCTGTGTCQVTMTAAATVTARFEPPGRGLFMINQNTDRLERIDPVTLVGADVGPLGVGYDLGDCAWNPADATLYMIDGQGARGLYRVNLQTGAATLVGLHGITNMLALAYHPPSGQLYGVATDAGNNLYTLSTVTGAATLIGPTGAQQVEGLAWDSQRNVMIALSAITNLFYSVNLATGAATSLQIPANLNNHGMTYDPTRDRFWVADMTPNIYQFVPGTFARTTATAFSSSHTCIAFLP